MVIDHIAALDLFANLDHFAALDQIVVIDHVSAQMYL
jgi:hypothetical protein